MGMVAHTCDFSTREAEPGGSLQVQGHPELQSQNMPQKRKNDNTYKFRSKSIICK